MLTRIEIRLVSGTVDIIALKRFMLVVIKLLKGYKEQCKTVSSPRKLDRPWLPYFVGRDDDIRF